MTAPTHNQFWKARASHGRKPLFDNPDDLWLACTEYFQWVEDNPLIVKEPVKFQGFGTLMDVPKLRAMTQIGLCTFLDVAPKTWREWKHSREDLSAIIERVEDIIFQQKFEGAAANLLNPNIIARELGLADKQETESRVTVDASGPALEKLSKVLGVSRTDPLSVEELDK